ncbi:hypothetical protein [Cardinium endosymbiont of Sogatella furcifera]|uniref:hypothetical protein n=1 Tax=Cardinium endosymbiont of Sogatella furcifera TaxID=650378 RepID=UPI000E0DDB41|nr:hypothetical protein [Cardinium endosymbiont of Sogatella furcifera]
MLHILDYLLKNNLVDPDRHDKNGELPLAKLISNAFFYAMQGNYSNDYFLNGADCCLDAFFLLVHYGANAKLQSGEIKKSLMNTVK